jgi:hypothetical protein
VTAPAPFLPPDADALAMEEILGGLPPQEPQPQEPQPQEPDKDDLLKVSAEEAAAEEGTPSPDEVREIERAALVAMYGAGCPLAADVPPVADDWVAWARSLWDDLTPGVQKRLHLTERNRLFRRGVQWVSSHGLGPWREPPKPRDAARVVYNMIDKALDQRQQIIAEQRPGFRTKPTTQDPDDIKQAEAQQLALEYQYDQQRMEDVIRAATYWAGTDGVAFLCSYWEPEAGPWHEVSLGAYGGAEATRRIRLGDIRTHVYRIEQVRVSPNATATERPYYWIVHETMPLGDAVRAHGAGVTAKSRGPGIADQTGSRLMGSVRLGMEMPGTHELHANQETVDRFTVYCEPSEYLPDGLTLLVVGDQLVYLGPLLCGVVPIARLTDGSSDPAFYPAPQMEGWLDAQMRVNAVLSKWVESVRRNADGRFLARKGSISTETLVNGMMNVIEVTGGTGPLSDQIAPVPAFSVGNDAKELLALEKKAFEDASGWNDTSRGSFAGDTSGRAILAIREQLERVFAPGVNAAARAMTEWGKIQLHWMRWGYDLPRMIGVTGQSRPDLGQAISADDFDGVCDVEIDAETLMPMPRPLRLFLLDSMYEKGIVTPQEYRRRLPFAWTRNLQTPDDDHEARARRVAEALRQRRPAPEVRWTDNEAIHQDVLEREILIHDDIEPDIIAAAQERWTLLANQAYQKLGGMAPQPNATSPDGGTASALSPMSQPMLGTNPGLASAPARMLMGGSDQQQAGTAFDRMNPT